MKHSFLNRVNVKSEIVSPLATPVRLSRCFGYLLGVYVTSNVNRLSKHVCIDSWSDTKHKI